MKSPTTASMPQHFASRHTASGKARNGDHLQGSAYSSGSGTVQYTPVRQQSKG